MENFGQTTAHATHAPRTGRSQSFAGQLAGLLHPTGKLSFVELIAFPHVEGALGFGRKVDRGNGREGGAVEEDQLEVGLEATARNQPWPAVDDRHYGARGDRANGAT